MLRWTAKPERSGNLTLEVTVVPLVADEASTTDEVGPERFSIEVSAENKSIYRSVSDGIGHLTEEPVLRAIPLTAAIVAALAAFWRWVLRRPWPWARQLVARDEAVDDGGSTPGKATDGGHSAG